jgi:hypothetical protein
MSGKAKVVAGLAALVVIGTGWYVVGLRPVATQEPLTLTTARRPGAIPSQRLPESVEGRSRVRPASPDAESAGSSAPKLPHTLPRSPNNLARRAGGAVAAPKSNAYGSETHAEADRFEQTKRTALSDPDPHERAGAIESLDSFDDAPILPVLARALDDPDPGVREAVVEQLRSAFDEPQLGLLSSALRDSDPQVRLAALRGIAASEEDARWPLIRSALEDADEDVRSAAAEIIQAAASGNSSPPAPDASEPRAPR